MSVGAYLRAVGAGYQPRAVVDRDRIRRHAQDQRRPRPPWRSAEALAQ
jgi:hypothetical protein